MWRCCSAPRNDLLCLLRGRLPPRWAPGGSSHGLRAAGCHPISHNVWESCLCSPWYYCTVLSPFLLSTVPVAAVLLECFHLFSPLLFFFLHFVHWVWYAVLFFLSVSVPHLFPPPFLACSLSLCMLYTTLPRKGTCLIPYHCWSRNLWKESWSWWTTCQALCAIIMPFQLPNITTLRTRLIFLISCKVSIQTQFDWDL